MRGNVLPIRDNPVLMIGADRCAEGAIGDIVALDWRSGFKLADMHLVGRYWYRIGGSVMKRWICPRFALDWRLGRGLDVILQIV